MGKYYKISESELLRLLARDLHFTCMECAEVDNWKDGRMVSELFEKYYKKAGLKTKENESYWYDYSFKDLAKVSLSDYQEVE